MRRVPQNNDNRVKALKEKRALEQTKNMLPKSEKSAKSDEKSVGGPKKWRIPTSFPHLSSGGHFVTWMPASEGFVPTTLFYIDAAKEQYSATSIQ